MRQETTEIAGLPLGHGRCNSKPASERSDKVTTTTILFLAAAAAVLALVLFFRLVLGVRVIGEDEAGLLVKRMGRRLPPGRIIALDGEAGYQAQLLPPGWHFGYPSWRYKVERIGLVTVPP